MPLSDATETFNWHPDAAPGGDGTTPALTSGDGTHAYQSPALIQSNRYVDFAAQPAGYKQGWSGKGVLDNTSDFVVDATLYTNASADKHLIIGCDTADYHGGVFGAGGCVVMTSTGTTYPFRVNVPYTEVNGLEFQQTTGSYGLIMIGANSIVRNVLATGGSVGSIGLGDSCGVENAVIRARYAGVYGLGTNPFARHVTVVPEAGQAPFRGVRSCITDYCVVADCGTDIGEAVSQSNNVTSDASAAGTNSAPNIPGADVFSNYAGGDYSLLSTAVARDIGGAGLGVVTDIVGVARDSTPDAGAFEYPAAGMMLTLDALAIAVPIDNVALAQARSLSPENVATSPVVADLSISQARAMALEGAAAGADVSGLALSSAYVFGLDALASTPALGDVAITQARALSLGGMVAVPVLLNLALSQGTVYNLVLSALAAPALVGDVAIARARALTLDGTAAPAKAANITVDQARALTMEGAAAGVDVQDLALSSAYVFALDALTAPPAVGDAVIVQARALSLDGTVAVPVSLNLALSQGTVYNLVLSPLSTPVPVGNVAITRAKALTLEDAAAGVNVGDLALSTAFVFSLDGLAVQPVIGNAAITQARALSLNDTVAPISAADLSLMVRGAVLIDGANAYVIDQNLGFVQIYYNGQNYFVINTGVFH